MQSTVADAEADDLVLLAVVEDWTVELGIGELVESIELEDEEIVFDDVAEVAVLEGEMDDEVEEVRL